MRYIAKRESPQAFERWKTEGDADWDPRYVDLGGERKRDLHQALRGEQGHLCCYCGGEISESDSHIEHFRPQSKFQSLDLDYPNLHVSCVRTPKGARSAWHCGHAKQSEFCEERAVSPIDEACEGRFIYALQSGAVYATDPHDAGAKYMGKLLGLDVEVLRERRREALEEVFNDEFVKSTNEEQLRAFAQTWRQPAEDGRTRKFGHVLARYAEQMIEEMRQAAKR